MQVYINLAEEKAKAGKNALEQNKELRKQNKSYEETLLKLQN